MLSARAVNIYGFVAIAIMLIMFVLVWAHVVPPGAGTALFYAAAALFAVRIILRIALARQQKKEGDVPGEGKSGEEGS